jgi:hypothetical protein
MAYRRLIKSLKEFLARLVIMGLLVGGTWLVLQYYTEQEIVAGANRFWVWWSHLLTGELAQYWNPAGAALSLGIAVLFVLNPLTRLLGLSRGRRGHGGGHSNDDFDTGGDDGGGD